MAIKLVTAQDKLKEDVKAVLEDAISREFETVFVIGLKDEQLHITASAFRSRLEITGALVEALKQL
jgi:hypothetical protein